MRFRTKVTAALLFAGMAPLLLAGYFGINALRSTALQSAQQSVEMNGSAKADAVKSYFDEQFKWMTTMSDSPLTAQAIDAFAVSANVLAEMGTVSLVPEDLHGFLADRHSRTANTDENALKRWITDADSVSQTLHQVYILNNPNPEGQKQAADSIAGGGRYSIAHRLYHPYYRDVQERFGFHDIFLIEPNEGRIVYSVMKEPDFGTSLTKGPYRANEFALRVSQMIQSQGETGPQFVDFSPYEPSFNAATAFALIPVGTGANFKGILAFQLRLEFVQSVVRRELGKVSGKVRSYILATDNSLRTMPDVESRYKVGDYLDSPLIKAIASGEASSYTAANEHGTEVIASVLALSLPGTSWRIVSEANLAETLSDADNAEQAALYAAAFLAGVIVISGLITAWLLLRPIAKLGLTLQSEASAANSSMTNAATVATSAVQSVAAIAEETNAQAEVVRDNSKLASDNVQQMSDSVEELATSITDVAKGVRETADLMSDASKKTYEAEKSLAALERVAERIGGMVDLINDVANRTNLLALNAAVEASHAGEAGRGFAVVASEIRKLAGRTTESTETIGSEVRQVMDAVQANSRAIKDIAAAVAKVTQMSRSLSEASLQQESVTNEMARRMAETAKRVAEVDQSIESVKSAAGTSAQAANDLSSQLSNVEVSSKQLATAVEQMAHRIQRL